MRDVPARRRWRAWIWSALATAGRVAVVHLLLSTGAMGEETEAVLFREDFEQGIGPQWIEQGFPSIRRHNVFSLATEADGNRYLEASSTRSCSGKGVRLAFAVSRCADVRWRWRISSTIESADLRRRAADDAAAKLIVLFQGPSRWNPLDNRMLVYVWDHSAAVGTVLPNAWMPERARMLVLRSGTDPVGGWVEERVDLARDFTRAFPGESPGEVQGLAFMADTDDTGTQATAGFDDLEVRCSAATPATP